MKTQETVVINLFAGPGAGKTTAAWGLCYYLKLRGFNVEYVNEVCKDLIWDGKTELLDGTFEHQSHILELQEQKLRRLEGVVDIIVTDSPLPIYSVYAKENQAQIEERALNMFQRYNNVNVFIGRNTGVPFEQTGRIHNLEESQEKDKQIRQLLKKHYIGFLDGYSAADVENIIDGLTRLTNLNPN